MSDTKNQSLYPYCIYAIAHSNKLKELRAGKIAWLEEGRRWVTGKTFYEDAKKNGQNLIVIFAPAEGTKFLYGYAEITDIKFIGKKTRYTVQNLKEFPKNTLPKTTLILKNTGEPIPSTYQRAYALCKTPKSVEILFDLGGIDSDDQENTFLLIWNPDVWAWDDLQDYVNGIKNKITWSCGNTKKICKGDRIFMMRVGVEPKGIFASGHALSDSYEDVHWKDEDKTANYVDIKINSLIDPAKYTILTKDQLIGRVSDKYLGTKQPWTPQASGLEIPPAIAEPLEKVWRDFSSDSSEPKYWLYRIMYPESRFGEGFGRQQWRKMLENGVAAQDYGERDYQDEKKHITQKKRNVNKLSNINKGDFVIAGLGNLRFAGYGEITSAFYQDGTSLNIKRDGYTFAFKERHDCNWTALPLEKGEPRSIDCHDLKSKGMKVDFNVGLCVRETDKKSFEAIKNMLDEAGAIRIPAKYASPKNEDNGYSDEEPWDSSEKEGKKTERLINYYERKPKLRKKAIECHGTKCVVCDFNFGARYGNRGEGFIEVHHLRPVSSLGEEGKINPRTDMTVLCPNCHRMIHKDRNHILTIDELKGIFKRE